MVEALRSRDIDVTLLQRSKQVLPTLDAELADLVAVEVRSHGAVVLTGITVTGVAAGDGAHRWTVHAPLVRTLHSLSQVGRFRPRAATGPTG